VTESSKPDPKETVERIQQNRVQQRERKDKLGPFLEAGWDKIGSEACRRFGGTIARVNWSGERGQFEMVIEGSREYLYFDTAKETIEYVDAVVKLLP
jgi:formylmethanofuran dehydrogenase subunit C